MKYYNYGPDDMSVAYAIVVGILDQDEIPDELLEAISGPLSFYQPMKARNELKEGHNDNWTNPSYNKGQGCILEHPERP
jgi:hypothetical protein